jgi:hypothetical protein
MALMPPRGWLAPSSSPTTRIAIGLLLIAALGIVAWFASSGLRAWAPSVTVGAITIAATITVIERAIQRETGLRIHPRVDLVMDRIRASLKWLLWSIAYDLVDTHDGEVQPFPADAIALTERWINDETQDSEDRRALPRGGGPPPIAVHAVQLVNDLEEVRSRDREVLEPTLIREMDDFVAEIHRATFLYEVVDAESRAEARSALAILTRYIVYATHNLALVFAAQNPEVIQLDQSIVLDVQRDSERRRDRGTPAARQQ